MESIMFKRNPIVEFTFEDSRAYFDDHYWHHYDRLGWRIGTFRTARQLVLASYPELWPQIEDLECDFAIAGRVRHRRPKCPDSM
jgi:hypothetical protein